MDENRHKVVLRRFYLTFFSLAMVVYLLLMGFVLPWWHASNHPVQVTLGAGTAEKIELAYSPNEDPLPLVPIGEPEGYQWFWGTELPPRPGYDLALVFPEGTTGEVVLKDIKVIRLTNGKETFSLGEGGLTDPADGLVHVRKTSSGFRIRADAGGSLQLAFNIPPVSPFSWLVVWFKSTVGFLIVAVVLFFTLATFIRFPDSVQAFRKRTPSYEVLILLACAIAGALVHLHLVRHAIPSFSPGESENFILQAIGVKADGSSLASPGLRPGYPAFLEQVASWTDWDLSNHTLVQAILFSLAAILLGLSCVRLIQGYILGPFVFLAFISPPALWASRHIGPESILSSAWIAALASFIFFWQRDGLLRWPAIVIFSGFAFLATAVSPAGLVLYFLPAALLVGTLWWTISVRGTEFWGMPILWKSVSQSLVPFVVLIIGSVTFSGNEAGSPSILSIPSPSQSAPYSSGMFEVGALVGQQAYLDFINDRSANGFTFDGPVMKRYPDMAGASYKALPLRAKLVAWGRLTGWGMFLPDVTTYGQQPLIKDYQLRTKFRNEAEAESIRNSVSLVMRQTGIVVHVMEKWSNRQIVAYNQSVLPVYKWFYRVLLLSALAGWMIGLAERKYLAAILVLPFLLKVITHILTFNVNSESIQSLDMCLWLGALAGLLCVNPKAMQKPTDESDRRCMPPIRPKRLMTRHKDVPGTSGLPVD
jgi:hypothetical protein